MDCTIIRSGEDLGGGSPSLFLAGPTPRNRWVPSWRPRALRVLLEKNFSGRIFIPEPFAGNYIEQTDWEYTALHEADCIMFWIPRIPIIMPGYITNVEFGYWCRSGKIVLGAPWYASKMKYLNRYADLFDIPRASTLEKTIDDALLQIGRTYLG